MDKGTTAGTIHLVAPLASLNLSQMLQKAASGARNSAQGFAEFFSAPPADPGVISQTKVDAGSSESRTNPLAEVFRKFLQGLGIPESQPVSLQIDETGDVWVSEGLEDRSAEIEAALEDQPELKRLLGKWADEHGPPGATVTFRWPTAVDESRPVDA